MHSEKSLVVEEASGSRERALQSERNPVVRGKSSSLRIPNPRLLRPNLGFGRQDLGVLDHVDAQIMLFI